MPNFKLVTDEGTYNAVVSSVGGQNVQWFLKKDGEGEEYQGKFDITSGNAFIKASERMISKLKVSGTSVYAVIVPERLLRRFLEKYRYEEMSIYLDNTLNDSL